MQTNPKTGATDSLPWRLYDDLAWLWPDFGSVEDYRQETEQVIGWMREHAHGPISSVLDIGCGGGKNAFYLKQLGQLTGVDISPAMLEQARRLNPESEFFCADMRDFELGREFDAIFVNDALVYMRTRADVECVLANAWNHLRQGGVLIFMVEISTESFVQQRTRITHTQPRPGCDVTIIEQDWRADSAMEEFELSFIYMIREQGRLRVEKDRHRWGLFPLQFWRELPSRRGYSVYQEILEGSDMVVPAYVCVKPSIT